MTDSASVLVVSPAPELASRVNSAVRGAGIVAQVEWARDAADAKDLLQKAYDLVFCDVPRVEAAKVVAVANGHQPPLPVIGVSEDAIDDELLHAGIGAGLRDLIAASRPVHIAAVARRELQAVSAQRRLNTAAAEADAARRERDAMFSKSGDALAHVEDGILVDANTAWAELFGAANAEAGVPLMDVFGRESRDRLKQALKKHAGGQMELTALGADGLAMPVSVSLRELKTDAGVLTEIAIRSGRGQRSLAEELERAQRLDADTGMLNRAAFVEALQRAGASDAIVVARIDQFVRVVEQLGVIGSDAVAVQFAKLVAAQAGSATVGRLEGTVLGLVMTANTEQAEAWCNRARDAIAAAVFEHGGRSTALTASFGIRAGDDAEPLKRLDDASAALRTARAGGGNKIEVYRAPQAAAEAPDERISDTEWANRLKRALMKGHFRLAFQPIASLRGETSEAHDSLLRLMDPEHGEVLPGEFLPAAQRIGMMIAIDRWVIADALKTLGDATHRKKGTTLFVRVSDDSLKDPTLLKWFDPQVRAAKLEPGRLVFELSAQQAEKWLKESRAFAEAVSALGCGVMLGRFGLNPAALQLVQHLPVGYVKFDVPVFDGLARDAKRQEAIKETLTDLGGRKIQSIAPGIEDANTMAMLWQLGVDYVQGNYLQEPEVVIADG